MFPARNNPCRGKAGVLRLWIQQDFTPNDIYRGFYWDKSLSFFKTASAQASTVISPSSFSTGQVIFASQASCKARLRISGPPPSYCTLYLYLHVTGCEWQMVILNGMCMDKAVLHIPMLQNGVFLVPHFLSVIACNIVPYSIPPRK